MNKFRTLKPEEIETKICTINEKGLTLLLYKTARTDQDLLDETVGEMNWQRDHKECKGNLFCGIGIYDTDKNLWVWKWDCGVESAFGDKEKGEASDSFKRAGFNWGIGRELYTSPFIWISSENYESKTKKGKNGEDIYYTYDTFNVEAIKYDNLRNIIALSIKNEKTGKRVFLIKPKEEKDKENKNENNK
jgi:hypothetical protein